MSTSPPSSESALADSIRPRLHSALQPLFTQSHSCLPALEKTCQKILSLAGGVTGADQLAQLVSRDPGLTCKVLQVSNSIAYSPQQVITSVPHAVSWLGLDTIRSIVTAAQLVEQLHEWPDRQQVISGIIERALLAAVHAHELGEAIEHSSLNQLFSSTLLYSIGDFAVAHQAPDLYHALRSISRTARTRPAQVIEETKLLGVPRVRLAEALAQMWALPPHLVELFSEKTDGLDGRWLNGRQTFTGLVVGSVALVDAMTGPSLRTAVEAAKRTLLTGTGLPSHLFGDILVRALDRGKQLIRSAGLSSDLLQEQPESRTSGQAATTSPAEPRSSATDPRPPRGPSAIETNPLQVLQGLQTAMQEAKDLNTLLGTLVRALHRDAGFVRVALALLNPHDSDQLIGRLLIGVKPAEAHLASLSGSLSKDHPAFLCLLKRSEPILLTDFTIPREAPINPSFLRLWNPGSGILAPLRIGNRPIGMMYCDCGPLPNQVQPRDYQAFQLFFTQTTLSMNRLAGVL